jgi:hypothetical protein
MNAHTPRALDGVERPLKEQTPYPVKRKKGGVQNREGERRQSVVENPDAAKPVDTDRIKEEEKGVEKTGGQTTRATRRWSRMLQNHS